MGGFNYKHNSSEIQLFSLSDCSVYFVTGLCRIVPYTLLQGWGGGGGGKLSRPVYLDPHPPEYQSKIILLSFLI